MANCPFLAPYTKSACPNLRTSCPFLIRSNIIQGARWPYVHLLSIWYAECYIPRTLYGSNVPCRVNDPCTFRWNGITTTRKISKAISMTLSVIHVYIDMCEHYNQVLHNMNMIYVGHNNRVLELSSRLFFENSCDRVVISWI